MHLFQDLCQILAGVSPGNSMTAVNVAQLKKI